MTHAESVLMSNGRLPSTTHAWMAADLAAVDRAGERPLHSAAAHGHVAVAEHLAARKAEVAGLASGGGRRPFHMAASEGHVPVARVLVSRGAEPTAASAALETPLFLSIQKGYLGIIEYLLLPGSRFFGSPEFCCVEPNPRRSGRLLAVARQACAHVALCCGAQTHAAGLATAALLRDDVAAAPAFAAGSLALPDEGGLGLPAREVFDAVA